ncbi:hypothetical protein [Clostridium aciditolerans]|nr:hypothetical protein [Clostridium aciditolerans]
MMIDVSYLREHGKVKSLPKEGESSDDVGSSRIFFWMSLVIQ